MSTQHVITFERVSKRYQLGQSRYFNRGYLVNDLLRAVTGRLQSDNDSNILWALNDVSFTVDQGETVGFVGSNGAGKSTILKILSRITKPTKGRAAVRGRVGSLLEIGTGFHPELTGRENIHLTAALLGMKRIEIDKKFDEILSFADIDHMIDTPIKHYSTGQYMRLGFAVAAHLDHQILIVDEVLAVGDIGFQSKCMSKMQQLVNDGRTILFVSHKLDQIEQLCTKALWLESGRLVDYGDVRPILARYKAKSEPAAQEVKV